MQLSRQSLLGSKVQAMVTDDSAERRRTCDLKSEAVGGWGNKPPFFSVCFPSRSHGGQVVASNW